MDHLLVCTRTMTIITQNIPSATRVIENVRSYRLLFHPNLKKIFLNIENEKNKFAKAKLVQFLIEFREEDFFKLQLF